MRVGRLLGDGPVVSPTDLRKRRLVRFSGRKRTLTSRHLSAEVGPIAGTDIPGMRRVTLASPELAWTLPSLLSDSTALWELCATRPVSVPSSLPWCLSCSLES